MPLDQLAVLTLVTRTLDANGICYMISGSSSRACAIIRTLSSRSTRPLHRRRLIRKLKVITEAGSDLRLYIRMGKILGLNGRETAGSRLPAWS
ncbi:MAG TPA: hypothetical protein VGY57_05390, partial [Vicinamibacterales bacterium]|nr:hypothetical protein [Vicinamibacterales bacterium]